MFRLFFVEKVSFTRVRMLPLDVVYHIRSFLRWRDRTLMVSREWLHGALTRSVRLRSWSGKLRMYAYLRVFGPEFSRMSWSSFCRKLLISRKVREGRAQPTWHAAAARFMRHHCKACGQQTRSCVMGVTVCTRCRFDPRLKYAYMIPVCLAKQLGVPKQVLNVVPYHKYRMCHLRFFHEIEEYIRK